MTPGPLNVLFLSQPESGQTPEYTSGKYVWHGEGASENKFKPILGSFE
jgi:hypothetical protein